MAFTGTYDAETTAFPTGGRIYRASSGGTVFSADLHSSTAFDLFDDTAVVNDAIYFTLGANQNLASGLKFNVGTALTAGTTLVWEYYKWTGTTSTKAWAAIEDLQDDTNGFTTTGANTVRFPQQWQPADLLVNGLTAYWVRCRISAVTYTVGAVSFTGTGLNDATSGGAYSGTGNSATYEVEIDATGIPDTFKWKKDSGAYTTGVAITGSAQTLSDGVTITFAATTGHTLGDKWTISVTSITEGGANQTTAVTYGRGRLTVSGTTDVSPGSFTDIYNWIVANKPYISVKKYGDGVFDFTKVPIVMNSRIVTTNETILLGQNSLGNYGAGGSTFNYLTSGVKIGNRGYDGSTFFVYGIHNSTILNFGANSKIYGSVMKVGKVGGDAHVYPGYCEVLGEFVDCFMEVAPRYSTGTLTNLRTTGYFILVGDLTATINGFAYVCGASQLFYKYGTLVGFTITGFDWAFINSTNAIVVYLYTYARRSNETLNFLNPVTTLPVFGSGVRPITGYVYPVSNLTAMKVYDDSAGTYTDYTTQASNTTADDVPLGGDVGDILYFGSTTYQYNFCLYFNRTGAANDYVYAWEWHDGTNWVALPPYFWDGTSNLSNTGYILAATYENTTNKSQAIDGVTAYWIRARITSKGTGSPTATQIRYQAITGVGGWKMYEKYSADVKVTDTVGTAINGATVVGTYAGGSSIFSTTTDSSGVITQQWVIYKQYEQDATATSTYFIKETINTNWTLTVSKAGYETYIAIVDITKKQDLTIALKKAKPIRMDLDGNLYTNLDIGNIGSYVDLLPIT